MVDPWRHWPEDEYPDETNAQQTIQDERFRSVQHLSATAHPDGSGQEGSGSASRAAVLRLTSEEAALLVLPGSVDFVYIDAQHDFLSVLADLCHWWPKLRSGGIIAGHDFDRRKWVFPVGLAALQFARHQGLQLHTTGETDWASWYIFKP